MRKKSLSFQPQKYASLEQSLDAFFCETFKAYEQPLKILAFRLVKDESLSKDIIQEVFIDFWELRHKIEEITNVEAFLFRMTRHKIVDALRKISVEQKLKEQIWYAMKDIANDNPTKMEATELNEMLSKAIHGLPPKRKQIYLLKTDEGKSYQDIAKEMNISQHTVKNQLSSAVHSIRLFINNKFTDPFTVLILWWFL